MLRIGLPDEHSRAEVFRVHTCLLPLERDVDFSSLVATTAGLTPARIAWLCRRAALEAVRRAVDAAPAGTEGTFILMCSCCGSCCCFCFCCAVVCCIMMVHNLVHNIYSQRL
ncbi:hypothetical protein T492DRAFT_450803 [Pavlovales sp. CCMP2436]|nr:hypothetical protein T492DRAFT_450803 [Pavlovales sp. CCMP2436]